MREGVTPSLLNAFERLVFLNGIGETRALLPKLEGRVGRVRAQCSREQRQL